MKREILSPGEKKRQAHQRLMKSIIIKRVHRNPLTFTCFNCGMSYQEHVKLHPKFCPNCKRSVM